MEPAEVRHKDPWSLATTTNLKRPRLRAELGPRRPGHTNRPPPRGHRPEPGTTCLRLVEASLASLRPDRPFDLITCVHGLHYVGDKLSLIARAASWLIDDGLFVANLDLANLKRPDGRAAGRVVSNDLGRAGVAYDRRNRLVICQGRNVVHLPYRYLGADDRAGPNYTGQPAVNSYYLGPS